MDTIRFNVSRLAARVSDGVPIQWMGREISSGPLEIELDPACESQGEIDYRDKRAKADFRILLRFPELASVLEGLGVDAALTRPVKAVLHSSGPVHDDHSFSLSSPVELEGHPLFPREETSAGVLPGT